MKVKVLKPFVIGDRSGDMGQVIDLSTERAERVIADGLAEKFVEPKKAEKPEK